MKLLIPLIRFYLQTLARFSPQLAGSQAHGLFSTPRLRRPIPSEAIDAMARAEAFDVFVETRRVAAYRWKGEGIADRPRPRVLLAHGWESRAARLAAWVDPLLDAGFEVVAFDAPAHGASDGRQANPLDFVEAMQAVIARTGPVSACVGHSLGGFSILLGIGGGELLQREGLNTERVVIVGGAESGVDAMRMFCQVLGLGETFLPLLLDAAGREAGHAIADFDAHRLFANHPVPTLWLHAPEDDTVPFEAAERVARTSPHVALERLDGLGHHRIARDPAVIQRGLDFLKHLSSNSAAA